MAEIISKVQTDYNPATEVPTVGIVSGAKANVVGAFTETVNPMLQKHLKRSESGGADYYAALQEKQQEAMAVDTSTMDKYQYNRFLQEYKAGINKVLMDYRVPHNEHSALRETSLSMLMDTNERFVETDPTKPQWIVDGLDGTIEMTPMDWDVVQENAKIKFGVEALEYLGKLQSDPKYNKTPEQEQELLNVYIEDQIQLLQDSNKYANAKVQIDLLVADKEGKKLKYEQEALSFTGDIIKGVMDTKLPSLLTAVKNGSMKPEEAFSDLIAHFNGKMDSEQVITTFSSFGVNAGDVREAQLDRLQPFADYFKAYDPNTILDKAALTERRKWEQFQYGLYNNLRGDVKRKFAAAPKLKDVTLAMEYIETLTNSKDDSDQTLLMLFNADESIRTFADNIDKVGVEPISTEEQKTALLNATNVVGKGLQNILQGYTYNPDQPHIAIEQAVAAAEILMANPNYNLLPESGRKTIESSIREIYATFGEKPQVKKVFDDEVKRLSGIPIKKWYE